MTKCRIISQPTQPLIDMYKMKTGEYAQVISHCNYNGLILRCVYASKAKGIKIISLSDDATWASSVLRGGVSVYILPKNTELQIIV